MEKERGRREGRKASSQRRDYEGPSLGFEVLDGDRKMVLDPPALGKQDKRGWWVPTGRSASFGSTPVLLSRATKCSTVCRQQTPSLVPRGLWKPAVLVAPGRRLEPQERGNTDQLLQPQGPSCCRPGQGSAFFRASRSDSLETESEEQGDFSRVREGSRSPDSRSLPHSPI